MTSKECLEKLYDACDKDLLYEQCGILDAYELYEVIKQDLDRLEKLEDNIKIHKETIKMQQNQIESLQSENQKLENAIEILKEVCSLNCDKTLETERQFLKLSQEEYELLKKVLGGE